MKLLAVDMLHDNGNGILGCHVKHESHSVVSDSLWTRGLYGPCNSLGQNTGMGSLALLWGIFPTQGLNPGLLHSRRIHYQLSHKGRLIPIIPTKSVLFPSSSTLIRCPITELWDTWRTRPSLWPASVRERKDTFIQLCVHLLSVRCSATDLGY